MPHDRFCRLAKDTVQPMALVAPSPDCEVAGIDKARASVLLKPKRPLNP